MNEGAVDLVHQFEQSVKATYKATLKEDPVSESYARTGALLLHQHQFEDGFEIEIHEYAGDKDFLKSIQGRKVLRSQLEQIHRKAAERHKLDFGLKESVNLVSRPDRSSVRLVGVRGLRFDLLYLPTVLQAIPNSSACIPGKSWQTQLALHAGSGDFDISYRTTCLLCDQDKQRLEVSLVETPATVTVLVLDLTLQPKGSFLIDVATKDQLPLTKKGDYRIQVRAKGEDLIGHPVDVLVADYHVKFELKRAEAPFDDEHLGPWQTEGK